MSEVMMDELSAGLAWAVKTARVSRSLTVEALAELSGVSRAMISKIERSEAQPTAVLLSKLATAFGVTLSELIVQAEGNQERVSRCRDQPVWTDPDTGYTRRAVSPTSSPSLELVEVVLSVGAEVSYPRVAYQFTDQQIWVLSGKLRFQEGQDVHDLAAGDCLQLGAAADCTFSNPGSRNCRYLVVLNKMKPTR
ncbi:XRE family transcriptional regulator [Glutamicibacter sp.]|uniref:helix-turn-helix domain-containing protein n=1 Tax=Glutamicibacter sp. TaxID=1931995 RepID=UPI0028BDD17E|nr:XRE family transcriptional regulator [Glutamicibacter sp.]